MWLASPVNVGNMLKSCRSKDPVNVGLCGRARRGWGQSALTEASQTGSDQIVIRNQAEARYEARSEFFGA